MRESVVTFHKEARASDSSDAGSTGCVNVREEDRFNTPALRCPRIKIAIIFDQVPQAGGAFHQSIGAVEQLKRVCGDIFEIQLFHQGNSGALWLKEIGL